MWLHTLTWLNGYITVTLDYDIHVTNKYSGPQTFFIILILYSILRYICICMVTGLQIRASTGVFSEEDNSSGM